MVKTNILRKSSKLALPKTEGGISYGRIELPTNDYIDVTKGVKDTLGAKINSSKPS